MRPPLEATLIVVALLAGACASAPINDAAFEAPDLPTPTSATETDPEASGANRSAPEPAATLVDRDCFDNEARCGVGQVAQVPDSPDLVEVGFRVISDSGAGVPVVLLENPSAPLALDPADFPDRPLIEIGSRTRWPGGPFVSCPEWSELAAEADAREIASATGACVDRLGAAGIDVNGFAREGLAADVTAVLTALGITEFDLIAPGIRADLVAVMADGPLSIRQVAYVDPYFSGPDPIVGEASRNLVALAATWDRCEEVESCETAGTVDEFLVAVEALDRDPIPYRDDTGEPIDADRLAGAIFQELETASGAAFLPDLHRLILERDAAALASYVDTAFFDSSAGGITTVCGRFRSDPDDFDNLPPLLRHRSLDAHTFLAASCPRWGVPAETPLAPPAGLTIDTLSSAFQPSGPAVREPTVGPPSQDCVVGAASAWFGAEAVDDTACRNPLSMTARSDGFELVEGQYFYDDDLTVRLDVPDTWTDWGGGTWYREADPLDATNLDIYVWEADTAEIAHAEMVSDWGLVDPVSTTRSVGGRDYLLATGRSDFYGTVFHAIAVVRILDTNIGVVLSAEERELASLIEAVVVPAVETTGLNN